MSDELLRSDPQIKAPLAKLPAGVAFPGDLPEALKTRVVYDAVVKQLVVMGALLRSERDQLLNLPANQSGTEYQDYAKAVNEIYATSERRIGFASGKMPLALPSFCTPLLFFVEADLPAGVSFPDDLPALLNGLVSYEQASRKLTFKGLMSPRKNPLRALDAGAAAAAIGKLAVAVPLPTERASQVHYDAASRACVSPLVGRGRTPAAVELL
jgi:hypothetical protein